MEKPERNQGFVRMRHMGQEPDRAVLQKLEQVIGEEHARFKYTKDLLDWENPVVTVTPEEKATYAAEHKKLDEQVLARVTAERLLDAQQLAALGKLLEGRRNMHIGGWGPPWERPAWPTGGPPPWAKKKNR